MNQPVGQELHGVGAGDITPCGLPRDDAERIAEAVPEAIADTRPAATIDALTTDGHETIGGVRYFVSVGAKDKANKLLDRLVKILTEIRRVGWDAEWNRPRG